MPDTISEIDRLRLSLLAEKGKRIEAETRAATLAMASLQGQHRALVQENEALQKELKERYGLQPSDAVDYSTGVITRTMKVVRNEAPPVDVSAAG